MGETLVDNLLRVHAELKKMNPDPVAEIRLGPKAYEVLIQGMKDRGGVRRVDAIISAPAFNSIPFFIDEGVGATECEVWRQSHVEQREDLGLTPNEYRRIYGVYHPRERE